MTKPTIGRNDPCHCGSGQKYKRQAPDYYRKVIDFVRAHPDQYEPEFEATFPRLVQKLDPAPTD